MYILKFAPLVALRYLCAVNPLNLLVSHDTHGRKGEVLTASCYVL
jgi:hypothetical protein